MDSDEVLGTTVLHDVDAGVATITLNRPEAGNAILPEQRDVIIELLGAADADPDGPGGRAAGRAATSAPAPTSGRSAAGRSGEPRSATACAA